MLSPALTDLSARLSLLRLRISLRLESDAHWPAFTGSMLHGWFGQSLQRADGRLYSVFYGQHAAMHPKPYSLVPASDQRTSWRAGSIYTFELKLFGSAIKLVQPVLEALDQGTGRGLGPGQTDYALSAVTSVTPAGERLGVVPHTMADYLRAPEPCSELIVRLQTPLRLKLGGKVCRQIPDIQLLAQHSCRRLCQLGEYWAVDDQRLLQEVQQGIPRGYQEQLTDLTYYEDWLRFSHKKKQQLPFGGLVGQLHATGALAPLLPYLSLGEQLQLGGKTTFGLGALQLII